MSQQIREWCFTLHEILDDFEVPDRFKHFRYCVYQAEKCPLSGAIHLQGYIEFKRSIRMNKVKQLFKVDSIHLEPRQGSRKQARDYCMKEESRWAPPIEFGTWEPDREQGQRTDFKAARELIVKKRKVEDLYKDPELDPIMTKYPRWAEKVHSAKPDGFKVDIELRPWQQQVVTLLDADPVHRRIIWIWSEASNTGKSTFFNYCSTKYDVLPCIGTKLWDILNAYDDEHILWFDLTRADKDYAPYKNLELLSNHGYQLATKGTPVTRKFVKSHILVTSNHKPDVGRLPGRFHIINVDNTDISPNVPVETLSSSSSSASEASPPREIRKRRSYRDMLDVFMDSNKQFND